MDKERAFAILHLATQTCSAALKAIQDPNTTVQGVESVSEGSLDTKLNDYTALLSLIHQNATKLAVALKPSSLAYSAAITPAKELAGHVDAFASCAYSVNEDQHGRALACEVRWSAEDVLSALECLLGVYTSDAHGEGGEARGRTGEPYLIRTGIVHEAIDRARGISRTNQEAVKKRWDGILGGLCDCDKEAQEMIEEEENESDQEAESGLNGSDDIEDGGWGDLDDVPLSKGKRRRASQEELAHLKTAQLLFKFTHALVKRMDLAILRPSARMASLTPRTLDKFLFCADKLLKAADDLVHALYIPQDSDAVSSKSKDLVALVDGLRSEMSSVGLVTYGQDGQGDNDVITDLVQKTASVKVAPDNEETAMFRERKWFNACFTQIFKLGASLA